MKPISLEEAAKRSGSAQKVRSLDELLSDLKPKVASPEGQVKTASAAPIAAEVVAPEAKTIEAKKELPDFIKEKIEEKKKDKDEDDVEVVEVDEKKEKDACMSKPANVTLKVAKKLDFRSWTAEDVVKAWEQHGTPQKCIENVAGKVSDPKTYCGLLQVAGSEAMKVVKASAAKQQKTASASTFVKISKLSDKDKSMLAKYYTRIYGKDYVDALLEDY